MQNLKVFLANGVDFQKTDGDQARGSCPFCGREGKFYVNPETAQWDCKVCGKKGGYQTFLAECADMFAQSCKGKILDALATARALPVSAFAGDGIGYDGYFYTIPIINEEGKTVDLRRWRAPKGKMLSAPGAKTCLWNAVEFSKKNRADEPVYVCEGEWDGMALQWLLKKAGRRGIVVAVPGAGTFKREWVPLFLNRDVFLLYDNDEAGENGEFLALERLSGTARKLKWLHWPEGLPIGFDVRDFVSHEAVEKKQPVKACHALHDMFRDTPRRRIKATVMTVPVPTGETRAPHADRTDIIKRYTKWLSLHDTNILDIMFGAVLANRLEGDPIWMFLVGPPGCAKSELLMSLSKSPLIETTTSLTPHALVSGAAFSGGADPSLIPRLDGKVLVIKDFTTILKMNQLARDEIFGILRDAYDGKTEKIFGTGIRRRYESRFGILAGVTPAVDSFSVLNASLGERFLKYRMDDPLKHTSEDDAIRRALGNVNQETTMRDAMLEIANGCLSQSLPSKIPELPDMYIDKTISLAKFAAIMRGTVDRDRFSRELLHMPMSEIGTRLAKQLKKMGLGIAMFRRKPAIGIGEYKLMCKVARDTCADKSEELIRTLYVVGNKGTTPLPTNIIAQNSRIPASTVSRSMEDFALLCIVERQGKSNAIEWRLSDHMIGLITKSEVYG